MIIEILVVTLLNHPHVLLKPVILGYVEGLASGRAIARCIRTDVAYIYFMWF